MNICYGNYKRGRICPYHVTKHCPFRFCPIARPKRNCREFLWLYTSTFQSLITSPFNIFALRINTINISLRLKYWFYMKILCAVWLCSGYMAPEYAMRGYLTNKADVYSFGVVALEIVSGKSNTNYRPKEEFVYLLDWVIKIASEFLSFYSLEVCYILPGFYLSKHWNHNLWLQICPNINNISA